VQLGFYLSTVHYRSEIVSTAVKVLASAEDETRIVAFLSRVAARFSSEVLGDIARLRLALLADDGDANLAILRALYEDLFMTVEEFDIWDITDQTNLGYGHIWRRVHELIDIPLSTVVITTDKTPLYKSRRPSASVKRLLPAGVQARVFYREPPSIMQQDSVIRIKIELADGQAGWVDSSSIGEIDEKQ